MQDPGLNRHLVVIRELNNHPLNQAVLPWLEEVKKQGLETDLGGGRQPVGPSPYSLHVLVLLRWAIENQSLRGRLKEEMIHHWNFLAADP